MPEATVGSDLGLLNATARDDHPTEATWSMVGEGPDGERGIGRRRLILNWLLMKKIVRTVAEEGKARAGHGVRMTMKLPCGRRMEKWGHADDVNARGASADFSRARDQTLVLIPYLLVVVEGVQAEVE